MMIIIILGTVQGDSPIIIKGLGFFPSLKWYCVFGDLAERAMWINSGELSCHTPKATDLSPSLVIVQIM